MTAPTPAPRPAEPYDLTSWSLPVKPCCGEALVGECCPCDDLGPAAGIPVVYLTGPWADLAPGGAR